MPTPEHPAADPRPHHTSALPVAAAMQSQRQSWNDVARSMPDFYGARTTQYYRRVEIALFERAFGDLRGKKVLKLDLWNEAINTRILQWVASRGAHAYGLDHSPVVARRALLNSREEHSKIGVLRADIRALPFRDGEFDCLYTMGTIEHIDEYDMALHEVHRVLRPGGTAVVGVPHKWDIYLRPLMVWILERFGRYAYSPEKSFSARELRRDIESTGLRVLSRTGILAFPGPLRMIDLFLFTRNLPGQALTRMLVEPFERLELRHEWARRLGYLIAMIVRKPERS
jgi:SAM-dependent methyltransferase